MKVIFVVGIFSVIGFTVLVSTVTGQSSKALSIHVLDNTNGKDGPNATCKIYKENASENFDLIGTMITDKYGRADLIPGENFTVGIYRIWVDTGDYFRAKGMDTFWPEWQVTFIVTNVEVDYHVPVTLSQFGLTTYHGS